MKILVVTNLYPPQELGGYGRCIADFVWGLEELGNEIHVLCSNAPYLEGLSEKSQDPKSSSVTLRRSLQLKGSYEHGVTEFKDIHTCQVIDDHNIQILSSISGDNWDGVLVGNVDLLGTVILHKLVEFPCPVFHHIGFISPSFLPNQLPISSNYYILPASFAVFANLIKLGFRTDERFIIYPGARCELFLPNNQTQPYSLSYSLNLAFEGIPLGSSSNPLKIGYAGLIMASKGAHTIVEAIINLRKIGIHIHANFAGSVFQDDYYSQIISLIKNHDLDNSIFFVGNLTRPHLARFWATNHIGIFPSIYPEAFGIVGAEIMASGLVLMSTGVGGSAELFVPNRSGIHFTPNDPVDLTNKINGLISTPHLMRDIAHEGLSRVRNQFSVLSLSNKLQSLYQSLS